MNGALLVIVITLFIGFTVIVVFLSQKIKELKQDSTTQLLKQDITNLNDSLQKINDGLKDHLTTRLDRSQDQIAKQYEASNKIIKDVTQKLEKLENTNKNVGDIAIELKSLQNVLQNPKQRGVLGEYYLAQILENVLPTGTFELQYKISEGLVVDAVIKMDDRLLPLDSKFPLENYNRLLEANADKQEVLTKAFREDVKKRIDETSKYIKPAKKTLDQALMFIPSEAIYYDLLANKVGIGGVNGRNLIQYALEKRVTIVGPSTLAAMLQTIGQGLRSLEIHKDTEKIRKNIEQLQKHLLAYNVYFSKIGNSLGTTVGHYNTASKELGKIDKDIVKIGGGESAIEPLLLEKPIQDD